MNEKATEIWLNPPNDRKALGAQTHLWKANFHDLRKSESFLESFISKNEKHRADSYKRKTDRSCFVIARGVLRFLLGRYLNIAPRDVRFEIGKFGKPYLKNSSIQFNISHSGRLALLGFSRTGCLGVDVEKIRTEIDFISIAERFFSSREYRALRSLPSKRIGEAFFNCWSRKEAFIKALGGGLSVPLKDFDVSLNSDSEPLLLSLRLKPETIEEWSMHSLKLEKGYVGAIAQRSASIDILKFNVDQNLFGLD